MMRVLEWPERRPGATIAAIGCVMAITYAVGLIALAKPDGRVVVGDALDHYVQLRSIVFDRDLQFRNEYARLYGLEEGSPVETEAWRNKLTATGHMRNYMPVGPALLWAPAFLLVSAGVWLLDLFGGGYPLDGYAPVFQAAAGFSGVAAAAAGSAFAYATAAALVGRRPAIWATVTIWLSSSAIYYSLVSPAYSHASSMLAVGAFWFAWTRTIGRQSAGRYILLGFLVGVAALMRWQDGVLLVVPVVDALWHRRATGLGAAATHVAVACVGAIAGFVPQMIVWTTLYGQPLTIPQGGGFMRWGHPALWSVLLSDNHGLLTWTPVIAFALVGLVLLVRRSPLAGLASLMFLTISWYVNASAADWWAGEAFGARRFVSCYPVFVLGFAALLERLQFRLTSVAAIAAAFASHTGLLLIQYQAYMHGLRDIAPYPHGFAELWLARFRTPVDILLRWLGS